MRSADPPTVISSLLDQDAVCLERKDPRLFRLTNAASREITNPLFHVRICLS